MTLALFTRTFDRWAVRLVLALRWRRNQKVIAERIRDFEATEDDSAWHLLSACSRDAQDPAVRAELFMQAMEETHHAEVFRALYKHAAGVKLDKVKVERKPIFVPGEEWKLFAVCAVGEAAAAARFRNIAEGLEPGAFKTSLQKILEEEEGHIELANDLAALTGRSHQELNAEMRMIKIRRAWETWLRIGRKVTVHASRLLLSLAYYTLGAWLKPRRKQ